MGMIGVLEITLIVPTLRVGNAAQDAPRPLSNVAQMRGQAPALSTSCARLTESAICAICDAERHGLNTHAEHEHDHRCCASGRVRQFALVLGLGVGVADDFERLFAYRLAVQEGVDLGVGHAMRSFVRFAGGQVFQVCRRHLLYQ